ncbi:hypothetical protein GCM10025865_25460 [Paraoerskovia sediminicola]|uniref:DNA primase DnaG DnaB-binding domain-containing protein n=1 Tax=Paraoerskovia sediminicola TaxID=1138587 RepID=A0ABM8G4W1_9CELL|nr:hypothetical protein [Paraoerskovia sediminicola]BDZ43247.1 hypothetical protein GCM10025865_25460 [Paraoerskovia sediminicola]
MTGGDAHEGGAPQVVALPAPDPRDPVARLERQALVAVLQHPDVVDSATFDALEDDAFVVPAWRAVHDAVRAAGGIRESQGMQPGRWVEAVCEAASEAVLPVVNELSVAPMPEDRPGAVEGYVRDVIRKLVDLGLTRRVADARSRLQRTDPAADADAYGAAFAELLAIEKERRELRESA